MRESGKKDMFELSCLGADFSRDVGMAMAMDIYPPG
jgi:hypothetical protein